MNDIGLTIIEDVAKGATSYKGPSKRNIGILGQFVRGAAFQPNKVSSIEDLNVIFGGQDPNFFGPRIVKNIFDEVGNAPVTLYVARVVGEDAVAATGTAPLGEEATMNVTAGYKGSKDAGVWGNNIKVTLYSYGYRAKDAFLLTIEYGEDIEQYQGASLAEIQSSVNRVSKYAIVEFTNEIPKIVMKNVVGTVTTTLSSNNLTGVGTSFLTALKVGSVLYDSTGKLIGTVQSITSNTSALLTSRAFVAVTGAAIKVRDDVSYTATLTGGLDGTVSESDFYPVESAIEPKGFACFDGYDVQILAHTEFHTLSLEKIFKQYLENRKGPIGVINLPLNADAGTAELYAMELQSAGTSYMAGYMGWVKVPDELGNIVLIPAIGAILGAGYIRTPYIQGDFIHIPPAGVDSVFNTVLDVVPARLSQTVINRVVREFTCNVIQYVENKGFYVGTSRSYSTDPLYQSIHIRMQTSYYSRSLFESMRFLEQKPNTPELRREALVELETFFKGEYDNGALERSIPFAKAYMGICDKSNNPPTQDRKVLNIDVLYVPTECTESIKISLQRNDGILTSITQ
jgi:hypothetical protein